MNFTSFLQLIAIFILQLCAGCTNHLIPREPYLQAVTSDSILIVWDTPVATQTWVEYGITPALGQLAREEKPAIHHAVQLKDLEPYTNYYYRVNDQEINTFRTAPLSGQSNFSFAAIGDTRTDHINHARVIDQLAKTSPDFLLHVGDMVEVGANPLDWGSFFQIEAPVLKKSPLYPTLGNHEARSQHYYNAFHLPGNENWYSFDYGNARFITLRLDDETQTGLATEQHTWLEQQLNTQLPWLIVFFHTPIFSSHSESDYEINMRHSLVPLFEKYHVDLVLTGHRHNYERLSINGITYLVVGGGGAPLYGFDVPEIASQKAVSAYHFAFFKVVDDHLSAKIIGIDGSIIDDFNLKASK